MADTFAIGRGGDFTLRFKELSHFGTVRLTHLTHFFDDRARADAGGQNQGHFFSAGAHGLKRRASLIDVGANGSGIGGAEMRRGGGGKSGHDSFNTPGRNGFTAGRGSAARVAGTPRRYGAGTRRARCSHAA